MIYIVLNTVLGKNLKCYFEEQISYKDTVYSSFFHITFTFGVLRYLDILVRIRILLFSSVTSMMPTRNKFFSNLLCFTFKRHIFTSVFKDVIKKSLNSRNQGFHKNFFLLMEGARSGSVQNNYGSGSRRPKNIRIRIDPEHCLWNFPSGHGC